MLPHLLYFEEQGQFAFVDYHYRTGAGVVEPGTERQPSELFGADHLLRLLGNVSPFPRFGGTFPDYTCLSVALPEMLANSSLDGYSAEIIGIFIQHLLEQVSSHRRVWFLRITIISDGWMIIGRAYSLHNPHMRNFRPITGQISRAGLDFHQSAIHPNDGRHHFVYSILC